MKYAVIAASGKQFVAVEGQAIDVDAVEKAKGEKVIFKNILFLRDGDSVTVGKPYVLGFVVEGMVGDSVRGKKLDIMKYKSKSRYRRHTGHRQTYVRVQIVKIGKE